MVTQTYTWANYDFIFFSYQYAGTMNTHIPRIVTKKRVNVCTSTSLIITTHYLHPQVPSIHFTSIWQPYISYIRREALTMYRQLPETVFQMARRLLHHRHLHPLDCESHGLQRKMHHVLLPNVLHRDCQYSLEANLCLVHVQNQLCLQADLCLYHDLRHQVLGLCL